MFVIILLLVGHLIKNQNWPSTILRGPRVFRTLHSSNCIVRLITSRCFRIHSFAASSVACVMHDSEQTIVTSVNTRCEQQQPNDDKRLIVATLIQKIICRITRILARALINFFIYLPNHFVYFGIHNSKAGNNVFSSR